MRYKAAIFDMDGTILSTIEDLSDSLNYSLRECGFRGDFSYEDTQLFFGSGIMNAIRRALALGAGAPKDILLKIGTDSESDVPSEWLPSDASTEKVRSFFNEWYPSHCDIKTGPYPGIHKMLDDLLEAGIRTAVVSNKIDPAVQELVSKHFEGKFIAARGEAAPLRRKPYPDMVEAVLKQLEVEPQEAVYIGDSEVDVQTAANAGLDCICVDWGFRTHDYISAHGGDIIVSDASEVTRLIIGL